MREMTNTMRITHHSGILSATISYGELIVFDLPAHRAGAPGTVTAEESADWTTQDWRQLARSRSRRARRNRPSANMDPAYAHEVLRTLESMAPGWSTRQVAPGKVEVYYGSTFIELWRREWVPRLGTVWARYPAGHAFPAEYSPTPPAL